MNRTDGAASARPNSSAAGPGSDTGSDSEPDSDAAKDEARRLSDLEDGQLTRACLEGDRGAFERLYTKHRDLVFRIVDRIVQNREDSLECVQEVFTKVYRKLHTYKPELRFLPWLCRVAKNQAIDQYRKKRRRSEQLYDPEFTLPHADAPSANRFADPAETLDREAVAEKIQEALATLPPKHLQVFVLFSFDEVSYGEISQILDIPIGTVMSRLYYARRKLQEVLPPDWDPGGRQTRKGPQP